MKELQGNSVTIIIIKPNSISYMFFVQLENKYLLYAYILFSYTYGKLYWPMHKCKLTIEIILSV